MMLKKYLPYLITGLIFFENMGSALSQPCKEIVGYYPGWQWYDRSRLVNPKSIDYSRYTIINYAFFAPDANGVISGTDAWGDDNVLRGDPDWNNGGYLPNTSLVDLAHNQNVKVLISIGGWTLSDNFPGIAASTAKRATFAGECVRLVKEYDLDGVDIDWEYPGYTDHNGTAADKVNFTLLIRQIRDSLDVLEPVHGRPLLLTAAVGAAPARMNDVEWSQVMQEFDFVNLMTYDYFGTWDAVSNHNAPLYQPAAGDAAFNLDASFTALTQVHGVDPTQITIGIAFYGRTVTGCTSLHGTHSGQADNGTFAADEGMPMYYNILQKMSLFNGYWDNQAQVPYLLGKTIGTFVSYDDEASIALKAQYAVDKNARGVIIWEITGDYIETSEGSGVIAGTPLADTLNSVLCGTPTQTADPEATGTLDFHIFPNPSGGDCRIVFENLPSQPATVEVYNALGEIIRQTYLEAGPALQVYRPERFEPGLYVVKLVLSEGRSVSKKALIAP